MTSTRLETLAQQRQRLDRQLLRLERNSQLFTTARVINALILMIAGVLALTLEQAAPYRIAAGAAAISFIWLVTRHNRLKRGIARWRMWRQIKVEHSARLMLDWAALPRALDVHAQPDHPFELDLDVTGENSLHRLLDTTATREGSERLRAWLLTTTPDPATIRQRQTLVKALKCLPVFRDKLALYGRGTPRHIARSLSWLQGRDQVQRGVLGALLAWALLNALLFLGHAFGVIGPLWQVSIPAYFIVFLIAAGGLGDVFAESLAARETVETLVEVFRYLEADRLGGQPELRKLCAPFLDRGQRPTRQLTLIRWVLIAASLRSNVVLWLPLNLVLPWDILVAWGLDHVRQRLGRLMPQWLDVWFELEALCALATYADLHPTAVFPVIATEARFDGQALGHPLIRETVKVRNDFSLHGNGQLVIITGSNMAGKSSFLRTLGLALCMAYAGGVVDAAALTVAPLRLFTCIRVSDSVIEGVSYFYAEVKRLKALLDAFTAPAPYPLFYLIDEIFKGTNNRERLIGSRSYIQALTDKPGMGVIATHDLELVQLADELPGVRNAHFREHVIDGAMVFDYQLRAGPSPTTNALKIMRLAGLPISEPAPDR